MKLSVAIFAVLLVVAVSAQSYGSPKGASYEAPKGYAEPAKQTYEAPKQQAYEAPKQTYEAPKQQTYEATKQTYEAPKGSSYEAPKGSSYEAPKEQAYEAPKQTYEAPKQTYEAPKQTSYTEPQYAPAPTYGGEQPSGYAPPAGAYGSSSSGYGAADTYYSPYNFAGHYAAAYTPRPNDYIPRAIPAPKAARQAPPSIVMYQSYVPYGDETTGYGAPSSGYAPPTGYRGSNGHGPTGGDYAAAPSPAPQATAYSVPTPTADLYGESPPAGYFPSYVPEDPEPAPQGYGPPARTSYTSTRSNYGSGYGYGAADTYYSPYNFAGHYAAAYTPRPNDYIPRAIAAPTTKAQAPPSIVMYQNYGSQYGASSGYSAPSYGASSYGASAYGAPTTAPAAYATAASAGSAAYSAPAAAGSYTATSAPSYEAVQGYAAGNLPPTYSGSSYSAGSGYLGTYSSGGAYLDNYLIPYYEPAKPKVEIKYDPYLYAKPPTYQTTQKTDIKYDPYLYAKPDPKWSQGYGAEQASYGQPSYGQQQPAYGQQQSGYAGAGQQMPAGGNNSGEELLPPAGGNNSGEDLLPPAQA